MPKVAPKPRGRPRKSTEKTAVDAANTPKRRGRPPKSQAAGVAASTTTKKTATGLPTPKRRGRPPKATTTTTSSRSSGGRVTKTKTPATPSLSKAKKITTKKAPRTIAGGYAVTCKAIADEWPNVRSDEFGLDISESATPGVYEASFDFGILEGVMVLSAEERLLEAHIEKLEDDDGQSGSETSSRAEEKKAPAAADTSTGKPTFQLQWRGATDSNRERQKYSGPYCGEITFTTKTFKKFSGTVDLAFVGGDVKIEGKRVTDESNGDASEWNDYGESSYRSGAVVGMDYAYYKDSNNWGHDRWGKWGFLG